MFERYTEHARRALFFARYEASELGDLEIKAEHLLLGLARSKPSTGARLLAGRGISLEDIRREIEKRSARCEKVSTSVEIPFNTETRRILQYGAEEADRLAHPHIGTEHLLLGILREEKSETARILIERGLSLTEARDAAARLAVDRPRPANPTELSALIAGLNSLLERLTALASNNVAAQNLLDEIRERVRALVRHLGRQPEIAASA
jgi:ATP-dependent Clp protease ATP-binding subunit ClpC